MELITKIGTSRSSLALGLPEPPTFTAPKDELSKAMGDAIRSQAKSLFYDPLFNNFGDNFKERPSTLDFKTLKMMAKRNPVVSAIHNTRISQVSEFARQADIREKSQNKPLGFRVVHKYKPMKEMTDKEKKIAQTYEDFISDCGYTPLVNTRTGKKRDNFVAFVKKITRDHLTYDQGCHTAGTQIELANGKWRLIEEMQIGDQVRTHTGKTQPVIEIMERHYCDKLIRIFCGGEVLEATKQHPLFCVKHPYFRQEFYQGQGILKWTEAQDVDNNTYLTYPKPKLSEQEHALTIFSSIQRKYPSVSYSEIAEIADVHIDTVKAILTDKYTRKSSLPGYVWEIANRLGFRLETKHDGESIKFTPELARFFGLYLAEGNCSNNMVRFTFHMDEEDLFQFIEKVAVSLGVTSGRTKSYGRNGYSIVLSSVELQRFMETHFKTGSSEKVIPDWILSSTKLCKQEFIRGYLEGDGCLTPTGCSLTTTSQHIFSGMRVLLADFNMYLRVSYSEGYKEGWSPQYRGYLSGKCWGEFANKIGFPYVCSDRPREPYIQDDNYFYLKVSKVEQLEVDCMVYNMEVREDHSYLANGVSSHNCFEKVQNRAGEPAEMWMVDASTIRIAVDADVKRGFPYVQVLNGGVVNQYSYKELAFCVSNPVTDIEHKGYGLSPLEQLIHVVASQLFADSYNQRFFSQGLGIQGILNIKNGGADGNVQKIPEDVLAAFRQQFQAQSVGAMNAWRTPVMSSPGLDWINLKPSNRDMEYQAWTNYLISITCAVYLIDPAEINFDQGKSGGQQPLFEASPEAKLKHSRDKGLKGLLDFIADTVTEHFITPYDDNYMMACVGLDGKEEEDVVKLRTEEVKSYKTIDEVREEAGLDSLPDGEGNIILDPQFAAARNARAMQQGMGGSNETGNNEPGSGEAETPEEEAARMKKEKLEE